MTIRKVLLATTMLMLPIAAEAQAPQQPVYGIYIGGAGGFNIQTSQAVNNIITNLPGAAGLNTPNTNVSSGIGAAAVGTIGYGLGNGFRVELEGDYRSNGFSSVTGNNRGSRSTGAAGSEQVFGPMVNVDYDFLNLIPYVVPYVGIGLGYQRAYLHDFTVFGPSNGTTIHSGDNRGSFAVQGIVGGAYDIEQVPGLALTAEYRIMALPGTRTYNASFNTITPEGFTNRFGKFQLGHLLSNTFLFGVRYNFGAAPPPPPAAPIPVAAPAPAPSRSYLVFFDWDKASLTDRARQIIKDAADNSTRVQYTRIEVNGYTDTSGTPRYNQGLSIRRAQAVAGELARDGVPQNVINIQGFGDTHLLVATGPGVREPQNRRVEIIIR
jgi:OOP family OmpA-OmpF porin